MPAVPHSGARTFSLPPNAEGVGRFSYASCTCEVGAKRRPRFSGAEHVFSPDFASSVGARRPFTRQYPSAPRRARDQSWSNPCHCKECTSRCNLPLTRLFRHSDPRQYNLARCLLNPFKSASARTPRAVCATRCWLAAPSASAAPSVSASPSSLPKARWKESSLSHLQPSQTGVCLQALVDNVRSAWNVGSIFRSAEGFGFDHLYLCGITPTPANEDVNKTALGAQDSVSWSSHRNAVDLATLPQAASLCHLGPRTHAELHIH